MEQNKRENVEKVAQVNTKILKISTLVIVAILIILAIALGILAMRGNNVLIGKTDINEEILAATTINIGAESNGSDVTADWDNTTKILTITSRDTSGGTIQKGRWDYYMASYGSSIQKLVFTNKVYVPEEGLKLGFRNMTTIENISYLDTSKAQSMESMFSGAEKLQSLDLSHFNTNNVTNMKLMFTGCKLLTNLKFSTFNTSKVTDMTMMFWQCEALQNLDLSTFNTSNVTNMSGMFYGCKALQSLKLSTNFKTTVVTDMSSMFFSCEKLTSLDLSSFSTNNATTMETMFDNCKSLVSLNINNLKTNNVTDMRDMFYNCNSLQSLNLSSFNTSNVTNMNAMFCGCNSLETLNLNNFDTSNVTDMTMMFGSCNLLTSLDLRSFSSAKLQKMASMFLSCSALESIQFGPNFTASEVTQMDNLFSQCKELNQVDVSKFDTRNVTSMLRMFYACNSLENLNVRNFNTSNVTDMSSMFAGCILLTSLDVTSFDTTKVKTMSEMFYNCRSLTSLNLSSFDMSSVTNCTNMIGGLSGINDLYSPKIYSKTETIRLPSGTFYNADDIGDTKIYSSIEPDTFTKSVHLKIGYSITYYSNGGSGTMDKQIKRPDIASQIMNNSFVAPEGKVFEKWNTSSGGTGTGYNPGDNYEKNSNLSLYAQWKSLKVTVTFKDGENQTTVEVEPGESATPPSWTKDGYTLSWQGNYENVEEDTTVTAVWTPKTDTAYKIKHWKQKLNGNASQHDTNNYEEVPGDQDDLKGTTDTEVTQDTQRTYINSYDGFTSPQPYEDTITINGNGSTVIDFYYTRKSYTVTLEKGTGIESVSSSGNVSVNEGEPKQYLYEERVTVTAVLSNGYEWSKWTGTGIVLEGTNNKEYTFTMPTQVVDLTANATAIQYQIQYELHGGKVEGAEQNPTTYTIEDQDIELKQPTKVGYTFTGWTEEGKGGDPQKDVTIESGSTGEKKYIANWEANTNTKYTVNYWKQILGKPAETSNVENYELIETKVYNDGTSDQQKTPTVIGYTGFESPQGQEVTIKADGTTEVNYYYTRKSYTVTLGKGTGIESVSSAGSVSGNGGETKQYLYEETVTVTAVEKAGYTWDKWTGTEIEGEGDRTQNSYTFKMPAKEVTLTANATANTNTQYTVKHWKQKLGAEVEPKNNTNYELVGDPQVLTGTTDESVQPAVNNYDGFVSPQPETVQISGDGRAEVNYYYTRRTDLSYTIKYIDKDETVEGKKEIQSEKTVGNQTFESEIDIEESIEKDVIKGYNYDSINPSDKLTISANSEENVITIYYTRKTGLSYTVKYIDKETMTEIENPKTRGEEPIQNPKVVGGKTFKDEITTSEEIRNDIYGYDYESIDPEDKLIIDEEESQNIINVYYTKKDASVLVHHYLRGTENNPEPTEISPDQTINGKVFEEYHTQPAQDKLAEYELVGDTDNTEGEMTEDQIEVTYYYILRVAKITATTDAEPENEKEYVIAGEKIKYIITIENSGNLSKEVEVKAEIPEGTTFVEGSIKVGEEARSDLGEQNLIDGIAVEVPMKEGETASRKVVSFEVQVKENQQGDIVSTAEIDEQETEEIRIPILEYEKTQKIIRRSNWLQLSSNQVTVGDKITYTINVTNTGTVGIENIEVSDKIPEGTKLVSTENNATQEGDEINWEIAEIAGGENKEETFTVEVEHLQGTHTIENIAKIDEKETNRVNYEYKEPIILFTSSTTKTSTTDKITSKEDKIHYIIEFNAEVDYFAGDITVKIVDKLPYKIDEKNSDIQEGEYNEEDKTITWYEKIENIDTFTTGEVKKIKVTKEIAINYIFEYTNGEIGSIRNSAQASVKFEEAETGEIVNPWEQEGVENPGKQPDEDGFIELEDQDGNTGNGRDENGGRDTDGDGIIDAWDTDGDGKDDAWDTDGDGEPDKWDEKGKGSADVDITIEIPTKVIVHHYIYNPDGEGTMLVEDEEIPGIIGQAYTTNVSSSIPSNYRCRDEHPVGYTGYMEEDPIEVTYYYELILPNIAEEGSGEGNQNNEIEITAIASEVKEDGTAVLTKERGVVSYNIKYTVKIEDYKGKARIEIVDKLPAGIDLSKSEIEEGTYSEINHTITWVEMIEDIDTFASGKTYTKEITKEIEVVYKDQNVIEDLVNEVEGTTTVFYPEEYLSKGGDELGKIRAGANVTVEQNHKVDLKVVKVWEDNENAKGRRPESVTVEIKVAQNGEGITEVLNEENNWTYEETTLPKYDVNTGEKINYVITEKESVVGDLMYYDTEEVQKAETEEDNITHYTYTITNVYKLTRADLNTSITKTGTEEITEKDQKVNYTINFKTEIKDYAGDGKVKIVDTLPYRIDEENSNLDGGIYDEENNTITWEMDILDMDTIAGEEGTGDDIGEIVKGTEGNVYAIDVTKQIKLTYIDMELEEEKIANSAKGTVELYETEQKDEATSNFDTDLEVQGKVIVKYINYDTNEEMKDEKTNKSYKYEITGKIGTGYTAEKKDIEGYECIEIIGDETGTIREADQEVIYYYKVLPDSKVTVRYVDIETNEDIKGETEQGTYTYEIKGKAGDEYETEQKEIPYYIYVKSTENTKGAMGREDSTVIYYYRKMVYNFSMEKTLTGVTINGQNVNISNNQLIKLELQPSEIKTAEIIARYNIKVTNNGELGGKAKVIEKVPKGFEMVEVPEYWKENADGTLNTEVELEVGESKDLSVVLKWVNNEGNLGALSNKAELKGGSNIANFEDTDSKDDISEATILVSIKTGWQVSTIITITIIMSMIITGGLMIIIIRKKDPHINDIGFLNK